MIRVAVLGCGYIDLELVRTFIADGYDMWNVCHSNDSLDTVETTGARAVRADVTDADSLGAVPGVDCVVFAVNSSGRGTDAARAVFVEGLRTVIDRFAVHDSSPERLVYTSSMGVYGDRGGDFVDESVSFDPTTDKTCVLAEAERVTREYAAERGVEGTVTRFAGFYGPDRYRLERYLNGPVTTGYLNVVHRNDAADAAVPFLEIDRVRDGTVLIADDEPVSKHELADWLADECGVSRPEKCTKGERLDTGDLLAAACRRILMNRCCSNDYLRELGYSFAYPAYWGGYRTAIDAYRADSD